MLIGRPIKMTNILIWKLYCHIIPGYEAESTGLTGKNLFVVSLDHRNYQRTKKDASFTRQVV